MFTYHLQAAGSFRIAKHIVLPEGDDDRIPQIRRPGLLQRRVAEPDHPRVTRGPGSRFRVAARTRCRPWAEREGARPSAPASLCGTSSPTSTPSCARRKGVTAEAGHEIIRDSSYFGTMAGIQRQWSTATWCPGAAHTHSAHGCVRRWRRSSGTVPGRRHGCPAIFLMCLPRIGCWPYGDCAGRSQPGRPEQLADIAICSGGHPPAQFGIEAAGWRCCPTPPAIPGRAPTSTRSGPATEIGACPGSRSCWSRDPSNMTPRSTHRSRQPKMRDSPVAGPREPC